MRVQSVINHSYSALHSTILTRIALPSGYVSKSLEQALEASYRLVQATPLIRDVINTFEAIALQQKNHQ